MPTQIPTSFASAAASNEGFANGRSPAGSGDWSRARNNGATATFRRTSQASSSAHAREPSQPATAASNVYVPPHMSSAFQASTPRTGGFENKYSKDQLLDLYKAQVSSHGPNGTSSEVLTEGWTPGAQTHTGNGGWMRRDDAKEGGNGPDLCWDPAASVKPLGLIDMDDEERELFTTSVNSPLKPPPQNPNKEGVQTPGINGRKSSISQMQNNGIHNPSMQAGRPGPRRRDTSDPISGNNPLASPSAYTARGSRDDPPVSTPPPSLMRRRTEFKEPVGSGERSRIDTSLDSNSPFGSFKRTQTGPMSAGINGPSSPWAAAPQSTGFSAFGNFSFEASTAQPPTPGEKKLGFGSIRGESRFKGLMGRDSSEDLVSRPKEKQSLSLLDRLGETDNDTQPSKWGHGSSVRPISRESNMLAEQRRVGSAALLGDDSSPPQQSYGMDQRRNQDEIGFPGFGEANGMASFREKMRRDTGMQDQSQQYSGQFDDNMSPGGTNTFQGLEGDSKGAGEHDTDEDGHSAPYGMRADRSQTSSANPGRGFGNLPGIGSLGLGNQGGWPAAPGAIGSSSRGASAFAPSYQDSVFGSMGDVSSPAGAFGTPSSGAFGTIGRGSKLGSLFPSSMQEQMHGSHAADTGYGRSGNTGGFGAPARDTDSPSRGQRGVLDDLFGNLDNRSRGIPSVSSPFASGDGPQRPDSQSGAQHSIIGGTGTSPPGTSDSSNQMPAAQKRQMVMPDRMRWIYRDPTGNTQGPWSGLEMHDWYKAGFFSPELQVRKQEDMEYEPLAQLIRRIGNSREPFLVPQIGIPHGPASSLPAAGVSVLGGALAVTTPSTQASSAQPPFPSNFPSFGTTLTAQQQNDLERRKQEEQFLMARQKEQLAAHQAMMKTMQMSGMAHGPQGLNHHSSAQSLHSQPSFGSINSPSAQLPGLQHAGSIPGFFDRPGPALGGFSGNDLTSPMDRMNMGQPGQAQFGNISHQASQEGFNHQQQVATMLQDRSRLQREQEQADLRGQGQPDDIESFDRLNEFQKLRVQDPSSSAPQGAIGTQPMRQERLGPLPAPDDFTYDNEIEEPFPVRHSKNTIGAPEQPPVAPQTTVAPAPSVSPLPAPAAQRNRQHVADTLAADSRSRSQTPSVDTPTAVLAPWAKENVEGTKGPSLKDIQEAEARKTAAQEEVAVANRRQLAEQERILATQAQAQAVAGLPSSANWAAGASPNTVASASAWAKKAAVATPAAGAKKTLAQIQKEEESRKQRAAVAAASNASVSASISSAGGKRYADLASKGPALSATAGSSAWTTVGASGKVKVSSTPAVGVPTRTTSGSVASPLASKPKAPVPARSNTASTASQSAHDDFQKWAKIALGKGLNSTINVDDFVRNLLALPADVELLSEAVYANSPTLDGRRFADEFVRRRKLADKGIAPEVGAAAGAASGGSGAASGGWSEVAKKGPEKEKERESAGQFKVVAPKKKGKR